MRRASADQLAGLGRICAFAPGGGLARVKRSALSNKLIRLADQPAGDRHVGMGIDEQIERVFLQLGSTRAG